MWPSLGLQHEGGKEKERETHHTSLNKDLGSCRRRTVKEPI